MISRDEAQRSYPELQGQDITGAAIWHDYVTVEADRLTFSWALSAAAHGAALANYVEATSLRADAGRVAGALAIDRCTGAELRIDARTVVNATAGSINRLLAPFSAQVTVPLLQAVNLVTNRPAPQAAIGGPECLGTQSLPRAVARNDALRHVGVAFDVRSR